MLGDKASPFPYHCVCEIKAKDEGEVKKNVLKMIRRSTEPNSTQSFQDKKQILLQGKILCNNTVVESS
jgi:hypothetical protein